MKELHENEIAPDHPSPDPDGPDWLPYLVRVHEQYVGRDHKPGTLSAFLTKQIPNNVPSANEPLRRPEASTFSH